MTYSTIPPIRKRATLLAALLGGLFSLAALAQPTVWDRSTAGSSNGNNEYVRDIAADTINGGVYVVGGYDQVSPMTPAAPLGQRDGFLTKTDANGTVLWTVRMGGTGDDGCQGVAVGATGNVYVTGYFSGNAPTFGTATPVIGNNGQSDIFLACYNASGSLQWVQTGGGLGFDVGYGVAVNTSGVFVQGVYWNAASFSASPTVVASSNFQQHSVLLKYSAAGALQWHLDGYGSGSDNAERITCDADGVYATGTFSGAQMDWYNVTALAAQPNINATGSRNIYAISVSNAGTMTWGQAVSNPGVSVAQANAIAVGCGSVFIAGLAKNGSTFPGNNIVSVAGSPGDYLYLAALDKSTGTTRWVRTAYGQESQETYAYDLAVNRSGDVLMSARFKRDTWFTDGTLIGTSLSGGNNADVLIARYSPFGQLAWTLLATGQDDDQAMAVACDNTGGIYTGGQFHTDLTFAGASTLNANAGSYFVAKLSDPATSYWPVNPTNWLPVTPMCSNAGITDLNNTLQASALEYVDAVTASGGATNPNNVIGAPNGTVATFSANGNTITADLTLTVLAGNTFSIRWGKNAAVAGSASFQLETSINGTAWTTVTAPTITSTSSALTNSTVRTTADTRYVRITMNTAISAIAFKVDAIKFFQGSVTGGTWSGTGVTAGGSFDPSALGGQTVSITYTAGNGACPYSTTKNITVTAAPSGTITYAGSPYCSNGGTASVTRTGTAGGTFSSTAGLSINASTGDVNLAASSPGSYTVTYSLPPSGGCAAFSTTTSITINQAPSATITYAGSPYCSTTATATVTQTGTPGGTYSSSAGLAINGATGVVTPSASVPGTYTVTYEIAATNSCAAYSTTTSITITAAPSATISYAGSQYCSNSGSATVTQTGTSGGTYSSTAGLSINATSGTVNLAASTAGTYTVTYTIAAANGCAQFQTTAPITINAAPGAVTITYAGTPFCRTAGTVAPTITGSTGGVFSASSASLSLNTNTGAVNTGTSVTGTYTVTYTYTNASGCSVSASTSITITQMPSATISYGSPAQYCTTSGNVNVTRSGTVGGVYSASPVGISFANPNGRIAPSSSSPGNYTVSYTFAAAGGCPQFVTTAPVMITAPDATIAYTGTPYCNNAGTATVTLNGPSGGTFTSTAGLSINGTTGTVNLAASSAGTFTVTYNVPAYGGCAAYATTTSITVKNSPTATISYSGTPFCTTVNSANVTFAGTLGGTYSASPIGLSISATTGALILSTSLPGTYTVTYLTPVVNGCVGTATAPITVTAAPSATISYAGSPYCSTSATATGSRTGTSGGTYTSTAGLSINASTGDVNLGASTANTYTVTYTIGASGGCPVFSTTTSVTITALPTASISYPGTPYCSNGSTATVVQTGATGGIYSGGQLAINATTGDIDLLASDDGNRTAKYTIAAANGCPQVEVTTDLVITEMPSATISYNGGSPICSTDDSEGVSQSGTNGGTYTSTAGLNINATSGNINALLSTPGTYTVTYTIAAANGCPSFSTTAPVTITQLPSGTLAYAGNPFCSNEGTALPTLSSAWSGTYDGDDFAINATTGAIDLATSNSGTHDVDYIIPAAAGCPEVKLTAEVSITETYSATIAYGAAAYCRSVSAEQDLIRTGDGGGTYTATPAGLSLNSGNGKIIPSLSLPGTYTVSYGLPANGGCPPYATTTMVTITAIPSATISYAGSPYCKSAVTATVTRTGTAGGTFSAPEGLSLNASTGDVNLATSTAGTYTVTYFIPASGGCGAYTTTTSITVNSNPATPTISAGSATTFCAGGSVALTSSAASSYLWSNGATTQSITVSASGSYSVTVTNASGCSAASAATSVTVNPLPVTPTITAGSATTFCAGGNVVLSSSSATGNVWSPGGATTQSITVSASGSYSVTVTNANGCSATSAATNVTVNPLPTPTISAGGATTFCAGGSVVLTSSAASSYSWSTGATTQSIPVNASGSYSVTVTNASGCTSAPSAATSVTVNPLPATPTISASGPTTFCAGGSVVLTSSSASNNTWSTGATTQSITVNTSGSYSVTVNNASGCLATSVAVPVTATTPSSATISYGNAPYCTNGGTAAVSRTGSTGGVYTSTAGLSLNGSTGAVDLAASTQGTYTVTYAIPANGGCPAFSTTASITITQAPFATIVYQNSPYCGSSGAKDVTLTGTTGGTFSAAAGLNINTTSGKIIPSSGSPGTYLVTYTVAAANGCAVFTTTTSVTINPVPTVDINYTASAYCTTTAPDAPVITGPTSGTFSSSPSGLAINSSSGVITPGSSAPGNYTVTYSYTDPNGCSDTSSEGITITVMPSATIGYSGSPYCSSQTTDQPITRTGTIGGTYSAAAGLSIDNTDGHIHPSLSTPGTYTVTYTIPANAGCPQFETTASITINGVASAGSNANITVCNSAASFDLFNQLGGTPQAGGSWSFSGSPHSSTFTPGTDVSGAYTYTVTASAPCLSASATVTVNQNAANSALISYPGSPYCSNAGVASVTLTGTGGGSYSSSPGLSLNASNGSVNLGGTTAGTYTVTYSVAGSAGCPPFSTTAQITINAAPAVSTGTYGPVCMNASPIVLTGSPAGGVWSGTGITGNSFDPGVGTQTVTYSATANGCSSSASTSITTNPVPATPSITAGGPTTFCAGGSVVLTSSSASGNVWSNGATTASITVTTSGNYSVTVTNGNGCTSAPSAATAVTVDPLPATPTITAGGPTIFCAGGSVTLTSSSTTGNVWSPGGATTQSITATTAGSYSVTVTNGNGCSANSAATNVTVNPNPATPTITAGSTTTFCAGGSVALTSSSATGNVWTPGGATTQSITATTSGSYTVTVTDGNGCSATSAPVSVTVNPYPVVSTGSYGPLCSNGAAITLTGAPAGGTWSGTGITGNSFNPSAGTQTVTYSVTSSGCTTSETTTISVTPAPSATVSYAGSPYCISAGIVSVTRTGTAGGSYSAPVALDLNGTSGDVNTLSSVPGTYTVTYLIPAAAGCAQYQTTTSITINALPPSAGSNGSLTVCSNGSSQSLMAHLGGFPANGGTWSGPSPTTGSYDPATMDPGVYTYTMSATAPCPSNSATVTVTEPAAPNAGTNGSLTICSNSPSTSLYSQLGGTPQAGGSWAGPSAVTGGMYDPASMNPGIYTYTVAGNPPCANASATVTVTENAAPLATISYAGPYCSDQGVVVWPTRTGTPGGTYSSSPGLALNSMNGGVGIFLSTPGTYTVTYTVAASGGCTQFETTASITITPAPAATINYGPSALCGNAGWVPVTFSGTTGGTYSSTLGLSLNTSTGAVNATTSSAGSYTVTYTVPASGGCGPFSTTAGVVIDNVPPTITCPANVTATTNSGCTATGVALGTPTTSDNCGLASVTNNAPAAFPLGSTTVTWTVTDNSGNTATCMHTVTVTDNVNPTITCPANVSATTNTGCTATGVALGTPVTNDNCGVASVTNNAPAAFPLGVTTVTWTVTDNSGRTATCNQTVTVTDNVPPTAVCQNATIVLDGSGTATLAANDINGGSNDNCAVASISASATTFNAIGTYTVTLTVTDASGNTATCTATVTVQDEDCLGVAGGTALPGTPCDDVDPATGNDVFQSDCNCLGEIIDCAGVVGGSATIDACGVCSGGTTGLIANASCTDCAGVVNGTAAVDACGVCAGGTTGVVPDATCADCAGVPNGTAVPGSPCDDGDASTMNDVYDANCACAGTPFTTDCLGVINGTTVPGTSCDDGDATTMNDVYDANCACAGTPFTTDCLGVINGTTVPGSACDDGDATTMNDVYDANCACAGTPFTTDCLGVINGTTVPGSACDDGNASTMNDVYDANCACAGTPFTTDCLGVINGTTVPGSACDDGDATTMNDVYDANCACAGTPFTTDCLGVINGTTVPGSACDDGDATTMNDVYDANCACAGTPFTTDCLGVINGTTVPGTSCDDGDASTMNDVYDANCACAGTPFTTDCLGVINGTTVPGTSCDDGDATTNDDVYDANCQCLGTPVDPCVPPSITGITSNSPVCASGQIVLSAEVTGSGPFTYQWSGPGQFDQGANTASVTVANGAAGPYELVVTNACGSADSSVTVAITAPPTAGTGSSISLCAGTPLDLNILLLNADTGGTWSGGSNLIIPVTSSAYIYTVSNLCGSDQASVMVNVSDAPTAGAGATITVCEGTMIDLDTLVTGADAGGLWSNGSDMIVASTTATYTYTIATQCGNDAVSVTVNVEEAPLAGTSENATVCAGTVIDLDTMLTGATTGGTWSTGDPVIIADATSSYTYSVINGCGSAQATVVVNVPAALNAGSDATSTLCPGGTVNLGDLMNGTAGGSYSAGPVVSAAGIYSYILTTACGSDTAMFTVLSGVAPNAGTDAAAVICEGQALDLTTLLSGADAGGVWSDGPEVSASGTYTYAVSNSCGMDIAEFSIVVNPVPLANAGNDESVCALSYTMQAQAPVGSGTWSSTSGVSFSNVNDPQATATVPASGQYSIVWSVSNGPCESSDTVTVTFQAPVSNLFLEAGPDQVLDIGTTTSLDAQASPGTSVNWSVISGSGVFNNPADLSTTISGLSIGTNMLLLQASFGPCAAGVDTLIIEVNDLFIPQGYSPNGDGSNDVFKITGINAYPGNEFKVFNRWGLEVYAGKDYQNDWDGRSNNGQMLPDDTYFYVLNLTGDLTYNGFIILKR